MGNIQATSWGENQKLTSYILLFEVLQALLLKPHLFITLSKVRIAKPKLTDLDIQYQFKGLVLT